MNWEKILGRKEDLQTLLFYIVLAPIFFPFVIALACSMIPGVNFGFWMFIYLLFQDGYVPKIIGLILLFLKTFYLIPILYMGCVICLLIICIRGMFK